MTSFNFGNEGNRNDSPIAYRAARDILATSRARNKHVVNLTGTSLHETRDKWLGTAAPYIQDIQNLGASLDIIIEQYPTSQAYFQNPNTTYGQYLPQENIHVLNYGNASGKSSWDATAKAAIEGVYGPTLIGILNKNAQLTESGNIEIVLNGDLVFEKLDTSLAGVNAAKISFADGVIKGTDLVLTPGQPLKFSYYVHEDFTNPELIFKELLPINNSATFVEKDTNKTYNFPIPQAGIDGIITHVEKTWDQSVLPEDKVSTTVELTKNGKTTAVAISPSSPIATMDEMPLYTSEGTIAYSDNDFTEVGENSKLISNYELVLNSDGSQTLKIQASYGPQTIKFKKTWENTPEEDIKPVTIALEAYVDGQKVEDISTIVGKDYLTSVTLNGSEANPWQGEFSDLPRVTNDGKAITYKLFEEGNYDYEVEYVSYPDKDIDQEIFNEKIPEIDVVNKSLKYPLKMKKVDGDTVNDTQPTPLSGAEFRLYYPVENTDPVEYKEVETGKVYKSSDDGIVDFGSLNPGFYYIEEVSPPEGYQKASGKYEVIVQNDGKIYFNDQALDSGESGQIHFITNYKEKTTAIGIKKVDENLDAISGASFVISDVNNPNRDLVNDPIATPSPQTGYGKFTELRAGTYRIDEKLAPKGYIKISGYYTFEVVASEDNNGQRSNTISWIKKHDNAEDKEGTVIYDANTKSDEDIIDLGSEEDPIIGFIVPNTPNKLQLKKVEKKLKEDDTEIPLEGVKFGLYYQVDSTFQGAEKYKKADGTEVSLMPVQRNDSPYIATSDADGLVTFEKLAQVDDNKKPLNYYIREIETKDGYKLLDKVLGPYQATDDGIIGPDGELIDSTQPIIVENEKLPDIEFIKMDGRTKDEESPTYLEAEFTLYRQDENNAYKEVILSEKEKTALDNGYVENNDSFYIIKSNSTDGRFKFEKLFDGKYAIKETKAPISSDGTYIKPTDYIVEFTIENGEIKEINYKNKLFGESKLETVEEAEININYVYNYKGEYPSTGGIGTLVFTLVGGALMTGTALVGRKKKKEEEEDRE